MTTLLAPSPMRAQEPEFFDIPFAPEQWTYGRRLDESRLRYCVDRRDPDWEVAAEIADALASGLLLEPQRYVVETAIVAQDITAVYDVMLQHCDLHMGFKLIPEGYADWLTVTRPYYEAEYVFVAADPEIAALADLPAGRPIGATSGTLAHLRLLSYIRAMPSAERWQAFPMGTSELALESLLNGTVDLALVWAPALWADRRANPAYADFEVIDPAPLRPTRLGVGAILLSDQTFLRNAVDQAITALTADGTIQSILDQHAFPATAISRRSTD